MNWSASHTCPQCGKVFRERKRRKFCSKSCSSKYNNGGEKNGRFIDGRYCDLITKIRHLPEYDDWRITIFKRDNFTCVKCGQKASKRLNAHHIQSFKILLSEFLNEYNQFSPIEDIDILVRLAINWKPFWDIAKGQTTCKNCHLAEHKEKECVSHT